MRIIWLHLDYSGALSATGITWMRRDWDDVIMQRLRKGEASSLDDISETGGLAVRLDFDLHATEYCYTDENSDWQVLDLSPRIQGVM